MYSLGLYPLIDKPTRITDISATLIENIFTNEMRHNITCGILFNDISDHLPIFALCEYQIRRNTKIYTQYTRVINKDTITLLTQELSLQSWDDILNLYDVNQAYDLFLNKFMGLFNKHCPIKRISRKSNIYKKPWFNKGLKRVCAKKRSFTKHLSYPVHMKLN